MFTEQELRNAGKRSAQVMGPVLLVSVLSVFAYLALLRNFGLLPAPQTGAGLEALFILPAFAVFLIPIMLAEHFVKRYAVKCPLCAADITRATQKLIVTRCCSKCGERIVSGGRVRSTAVYKRYLRWRARLFLQPWLWAWPVFSGLCLGWQYLEPSSFRHCPHVLVLPALIGTVAAGWVWLRTQQRRYVPQFLVSMILLAVGSLAFWQAV